MRILVFSDSHGRTGDMLEVLDTVPCDLALHLGDCTADCDDIRALYPMLCLWQVAGNDFRDTLSGLNYEDVFELEGVRIFMTHGHRLGVSRDREGLCAQAAARGAVLALYGHTHVPKLERLDGVTCFNPGSITLPRGGSGRSYGLITLEAGQFTCEAVRL